MPDNGFGRAGIDPLRLNNTDQQVAPGSLGGQLKIAYGQHTSVAAADTVVTGLTTVVKVIAVLDDDPVVGATYCSASIGNQAGAPVAGSVILKTWKATTAGAAGNPDPVAATTFGKKINWIAFGT